MNKLLAALPVAALLVGGAVPAQAAPAKLKVVYGWATKSGNSAMIVKPYRARLTEAGESGIPVWDLYKRRGTPIRIDYTEGLDFHQVNKKCGKRSAGYPYDTSSKRAYGTKACHPGDLYTLLKTGRIPVRVVYDPAGPMAVKVTELVIP